MDYADGGDMYTKIANQKKAGKGKRSLNIYFNSNVLRRLDIRLVCVDGFSNKTYS